MAADITARKKTVKKQGVRGEFTATEFRPVINGVVQNVGCATEGEAIAWGKKRAARLGL